MVIVGERVTPPDWELDQEPEAPDHRPQVSIYRGPSVRGERRLLVISALRDGRTASDVETFQAARAPNRLGGGSWAEVVLTARELRRRERVRAAAQPLNLDIEEGVLTSADALRGRRVVQTLPAATLGRLGWPGRKAGVFILQPDEHQALGALNPGEQELIRPVINSKDLLPYAAVLPPDPERMIYLARPPELRGLPQAQMRNVAFPAGLPNIERHLTQFRPYLEDRIDRYNDRRPWWTIHRPRERTVNRADSGVKWADYCVTSRWGPGERLIVGLAPVHAVPQSGLHALLAPAEIRAAYVSGLLNSTVVQDLASTIPPGQIRTSDLEELGLPLIPATVNDIANLAVKLADDVELLARDLSVRFPRLVDSLREDIALSVVPDEAWVIPNPGRFGYGEMNRVDWVREVTPRGAQATRAIAVTTEATLFGHEIVVQSVTGARLTLAVEETEPQLLDTVAAYVAGLIANGAQLRDIAIAAVPLSPQDLIASREADQQALQVAVDRYRGRRLEIDEIVDAVI
jgi:hypothetical protein